MVNIFILYFYYSMCYDKIVTNQMNITHTKIEFDSRRG